MDLTFTDEQQALRDAVRELCAAAPPADRLRELEDDPVGYDAGFWRELAQMDLLGLTMPEAHGGSGMGALESVIVAEELGRVLAPSPYLVSCIAAGGLLAAAGSDDQRPRGSRASPAVTPSSPWRGTSREASDGPAGIRLEGRDDGDELRRRGTKIVVPSRPADSALLVLARAGRGDRTSTSSSSTGTADGLEDRPHADARQRRVVRGPLHRRPGPRVGTARGARQRVGHLPRARWTPR